MDICYYFVLNEPGLFFRANQHLTVCLDEIQMAPELFSVLRSEIDRDRRPGRFILLGSASRDLLQKTSESLAGRIGLIELTPFTISELERESDYELNKLWLHRTQIYCKFSFYRSATGDELDLIIEKADKMLAVECKASTAPQVNKGFWNAIETTQPDKAYIIAPVNSSYFYKSNVKVSGLSNFLKEAADFFELST